jgi:hypothetical protein
MQYNCASAHICTPADNPFLKEDTSPDPLQRHDTLDAGQSFKPARKRVVVTPPGSHLFLRKIEPVREPCEKRHSTRIPCVAKRTKHQRANWRVALIGHHVLGARAPEKLVIQLWLLKRKQDVPAV